MASPESFPPVRACLFDMDGLLLDTEDLYTLCVNTILAKFDKGPLPWSIKAQLQGRPGPSSNAIFQKWANLPISQEEYFNELSQLHQMHFPTSKPLPGVPELLKNLSSTRNVHDGTSPVRGRVHIALATSSHEVNFLLKTSHLKELFSVFESDRRVLGDDKRIAAGRGKPLPDIYLLALKTINESLEEGEDPIRPEECLVFEDSIPGIEAGRRAGMRVVWCPHPMLKKEYEGKEGEILAGRMGMGEGDEHQLGEINDGWGDYLPTLEDFPYEKYGIKPHFVEP